MNTTPLHILLADDDEDDRLIFKEVINEVRVKTKLTVVNDGVQLMEYLQETEDDLPHIVFLDLNMPKKTGLDCLVEIRAKRHFSRMPIVIFSSARESRFMDSSYGYGANLYYSKPASFNELIAGLSKLLRMDWDDPLTITSDHFVGNKFVAYNAATFN